MELKIVLVEFKCFFQGNEDDDDRWIAIIEDLDNIHDVEDLQCRNSTQIQRDYPQ